jgi:hypothetical protein
MNKKPVPCLFIPREPNRFIRTSLVHVWSTLSCFLDRLITGSLCVRCRSSGCVFSFWLMMHHVFLAFRFRVWRSWINPTPLRLLDDPDPTYASAWVLCYCLFVFFWIFLLFAHILVFFTPSPCLKLLENSIKFCDCFSSFLFFFSVCCDVIISKMEKIIMRCVLALSLEFYGKNLWECA